MKRVTIKDVAKKANVSASSVSNALNPNSKKISDKKRAEILKIVDQLGYFPDSSAQSLSSLSTTKIGLFIKNSGEYQEDNSINMQLIYNINKLAIIKNIEIINIISVEDNKSSFNLIYRNIVAHKLTHLIVFGLDKDNYVIDRLKEVDVKIIYIDLPITQNNSTFISIDNYEAQKSLLKYTIQKLKFNKLIYISGDQNSYVGIERMRSVKSFCNKNGVDLHLIIGDFTEEVGYNEISKLNFTKDTVIGCGCDITAIGAINYLKENNLTNYVLGFDGLHVMKYIYNQFITVKQNFDELAIVAIEMILDNDLSPKIIQYEIISN